MILSATSSNDIHKCTQAALRWPAQTGLNYTEYTWGHPARNLLSIAILYLTVHMNACTHLGRVTLSPGVHVVSSRGGHRRLLYNYKDNNTGM